MRRLHSMKILWIIILGCMLLIQCERSSQDRTLAIVGEILNNRDSHFYLDTKNYPQKDKALPIGVFDSGTGGLTVLDAIVRFDQFDNNTTAWNKQGDGVKDFQKEYFLYLADQANMPYGIYSAENKVDLLKEHIIKDAQFLMGNRYYTSRDATSHSSDKSPVKAIVIACNTATAYGKTDIEDFVSKAGLDMKIIGVIDAGVKGALESIKRDEDAVVGIFATAGTVSSNGYVNTLSRMTGELNYTGNISAYQQAGIGIAGAIDGDSDYIFLDATSPRDDYKGPTLTSTIAKIDPEIMDRYGFNWENNGMLFNGKQQTPSHLQFNSVENYIAYHVTSLMEKIRNANDDKKLKSIILGCTHYPFYADVFQKNLKRLFNYEEDGSHVYRPYMADHIVLIDPAINTAKELYQYLAEKDLFNQQDLNQSEFYISVANIQNKDVILDASSNFIYDYKYGRNSGMHIEFVKRVPFSNNNIALDVLQRLAQKMPFVYDLIVHFNQTNSKLDEVSPEHRIK